MAHEVELGGKFKVGGFIYNLVDSVSSNSVGLRNGQTFYLHAITDGKDSYFYLSDDMVKGDPEISGIDMLMRTRSHFITDPLIGGRHNGKPEWFGKQILKIFDESEGALNEGVWPLAGDRIYFCTEQYPLELIFESQNGGEILKPVMEESFNFLEALVPRKDWDPKTYKLGRLDLSPALKDAYLNSCPSKIEPFGHWHERAGPIYADIMNAFRNTHKNGRSKGWESDAAYSTWY